jgi:hypothetical protein
VLHAGRAEGKQSQRGEPHDEAFCHNFAGTRFTVL